MCEYWSCVDESASDSAVCLSHESLFKSGNLSECPLCDQLKECEFALCGECESLSVSGKILEFDIDGFRTRDMEGVDDT
jgi:hypothetical protein